jgi:hypothetical protein
MGWTCTVVQNKEELPAILKRKAFDAVVIDLGRSMAEAQKAIRRIAHIRPSLVGRILALNSQGTGRGMLEFIERNDLIQLSHSSRRFVQNEHFARIVFALIRTLIASHPLLPRREQTPKKQSRRARLCA